jgi:hypothetical protein
MNEAADLRHSKAGLLKELKATKETYFSYQTKQQQFKARM